MLTEIYFPSLNTNFSCDYDIKITNAEYDAMVSDSIYNTHKKVENFLHNGVVYHNKQNEIKDIKDRIEYQPIEAYLKLYNSSNEITDEYFYDLINSGKMSLLVVNMNPQSFEYDLEQDIRLWMGQSKQINSDNTINNNSKLLRLPSVILKVKLNDGRIIILENCKILKDNSDKNFPYNIVIVIEKIILEK